MWFSYYQSKRIICFYHSIMDQENYEKRCQNIQQFYPSNNQMPQLFSTISSTPSYLQAEAMMIKPDQDHSKRSIEGNLAPPTLTSNRQILDKRRNLVMALFEQHGYYPPDNVTASFQQLHKDLFPLKWNLQVKIREVRQNIMKKR